MTEHTDLAMREIVWAKMAELGVNQVVVQFSGSGDSGEITDVDVELTPDSAGLSAAFHAAQVTLDPTKPPTQLAELIRDLSGEILQNGEIPDWYNNDGGDGALDWILEGVEEATGEGRSRFVQVTVNQYYTECNTTVHVF